MPALIAVGGALATQPANAFELGDLQVQSHLGQPLRASIAYALGKNEHLAAYCVSLQPGADGAGLPAVNQATISVADGVIALAGTHALREPLVTARISVNCPYTPRITREYTLFLDPATPLATRPNEVTQSPQVSATPRQVTASPMRTVAPRANQATHVVAPDRPARPGIASTSRYHVQAGDSLSEIAQRIQNRSMGIWPAAAAIQAANPDAFINNDADQLKAGSWLQIPDEVTSATTTSAPSDLIAAPAIVTPSTANSTVTDAVPFTPTVATLNSPATTSEPAALAALQPGDVVRDNNDTGSDNPAATTAIAVSPATTPAVQNDTQSIAMPMQSEPANAWSWLLWLVGGGLAIIAALLLFRRSLGGKPAGTKNGSDDAQPMRRSSDDTTQTVAIVADPDFALADDAPTSENPALDANLASGSGFVGKNSLDRAASFGLDGAQDFSFAETSVLDLELPDDSDEADVPATDIIPPLRIDPESILEAEILPDDDDYDMSVIVDATKMPDPQDVTERDLQAVAIPDDDTTQIENNYTISKEADYSILEQDYEVELSATQILKLEITRAAADLAERMEDDDTTEATSINLSDVDATARLPANDESGHTIETNNLSDAEATQSSITANITALDKTTELPSAHSLSPDSDEQTVELEAETGTFNSRAKRR